MTQDLVENHPNNLGVENIHLYFDSLTTLMTIWLPITFPLTWLFIFYTCLFDFHFTTHFRIGNYIIHKNNGTYDDSWHYMAWHYWKRLLDDIEMWSQSYFSFIFKNICAILDVNDKYDFLFISTLQRVANGMESSWVWIFDLLF